MINDAGSQNCKEICNRFSEIVAFDLVYTSPLNRAVETAELISGFDQTHSRFRKVDGLVERDFKTFEGQPWEKMDQALAENNLKNYNHLDIEPVDDVKRRLRSFLKNLQHNLGVESIYKEKMKHILIVTHGEIFSVLLELMMETSTNVNAKSVQFPYWPRNLQIAKLLFQSDSFNLLDVDFSFDS